MARVTFGSLFRQSSAPINNILSTPMSEEKVKQEKVRSTGEGAAGQANDEDGLHELREGEEEEDEEDEELNEAEDWQQDHDWEESEPEEDCEDEEEEGEIEAEDEVDDSDSDDEASVNADLSDVNEECVDEQEETREDEQSNIAVTEQVGSSTPATTCFEKASLLLRRSLTRDAEQSVAGTVEQRPNARSSVATAEDEAEECSEGDEYQYEHLGVQDESEQEDDSSMASSEGWDESDDSGSGWSPSSESWDKSPSYSNSGAGSYTGSSSGSDTFALYDLRESMEYLSYHVSSVTPLLSHINTSLAQISERQQQRQHIAHSTTATSRCTELGWPAATMSLLSVLTMLIMPLWLPWAWQEQSDD